MPAIFRSNKKASSPWRIELGEDGSFVIYHFGQVAFCLICHDAQTERFENVHRMLRLLYQRRLFDEVIFQAFRNSINGQIIDLMLGKRAG